MDCIVLNGKNIVNIIVNTLGRIQKVAGMACVKLLSHILPTGTEENQEKRKSGYLDGFRHVGSMSADVLDVASCRC
jgi:hypothetical protein